MLELTALSAIALLPSTDQLAILVCPSLSLSLSLFSPQTPKNIHYTAQVCDPGDQQVLANFWVSLERIGTLAWDTTSNCCDYPEVTCKFGRVVELYDTQTFLNPSECTRNPLSPFDRGIDSKTITGTLPASFQSLTQLRFLQDSSFFSFLRDGKFYSPSKLV